MSEYETVSLLRWIAQHIRPEHADTAMDLMERFAADNPDYINLGWSVIASRAGVYDACKP